MKILVLFILFTCAKISCLVAQPSIQWQKSLGGSAFDWGRDVIQTFDGGYIVAGVTRSNDGDVTVYQGGFGDCWIVKLSSSGTIEWEKSYGGTGADAAACIRQTSDSGYIVAGTSDSNDGDVTGNHGSDDYWIFKLDNAGTLQWQKSLGGSLTDGPNSIEQTIDGGYIVAGSSESSDGDITANHGSFDYWIVKLSSTGTIEWQKSFGGTGDDFAYSVHQTTDSGYVVGGYSDSMDSDVVGNHSLGYDYWILKLNNAGTIQWKKCLGGTGPEMAYSTQQTFDGGYVVAGMSSSNDGDVTGNHGVKDFWVVKLTSTGAIQWEKSLGGTYWEGASSISQTADSGFVVAGYTQSYSKEVLGD